MDAKQRLYVADQRNHRVVRLDDMQGRGWTTWNAQPKHAVDSVWVDAQGHIYVADPQQEQIERMDDMTGRNWTCFYAIAPERFREPRTVIVR